MFSLPCIFPTYFRCGMVLGRTNNGHAGRGKDFKTPKFSFKIFLHILTPTVIHWNAEKKPTPIPIFFRLKSRKEKHKAFEACMDSGNVLSTKYSTPHLFLIKDTSFNEFRRYMLLSAVTLSYEEQKVPEKCGGTSYRRNP